MLFVLLVRGATLPGATQGIIYYLKPNVTRLADPQVQQHKRALALCVRKRWQILKSITSEDIFLVVLAGHTAAPTGRRAELSGE